MISKALQFTNDLIDQFLRNRFVLEESRVILNNLIEANGSVPEVNKNKVILSLINIEKETIQPFYVRHQQMANGSYADVNPDERYNLYVLVSSNFDNYQESLKFLNEVILFFQINAMVNAYSFANLPIGLERLEFEIEKINYQQMQGLWTAMGAKYQPSVIYKMRLINIQGNQVKGFDGAIVQTSNQMAT